MQIYPTNIRRILRSVSLSFLTAACVLSQLALQAAPDPTATPTPSDTSAAGPLYRFVNRTGKFSDKECFWSLNGGKEWHSFAESPTLTCPLKNGRVYFCVGATPPQSLGRTGYWDFIEFAANPANKNNKFPTWHGNTTQVDAFCLPITVEMGNKSVGITESRTALFEQFRKEAPEGFKSCVIDDKRIVSPCSADFNANKPYANYFQAYIDEVWAMYAQEKKTPSGKWIGKVEEGKLTFTSVDGSKTYSCKSKPDTQNAFMGTGVLANNSRFCGAINRHVLADPADWDTPAAYYKTEPYNFYAKFLHEHSIDKKAYGFCYDDDGGQAAFFSNSGPELTVTLYWDTPPAKK